MLVMPAISMRKTEFMSPAPNSGKNGCINNVSNLVTPLVTELEANMPTKNTSKAALDMHKKWQEQANSMGGPNARIVVEKRKAKKLIFDMLHDAFAPMNITQIHKVRFGKVQSCRASSRRQLLTCTTLRIDIFIDSCLKLLFLPRC